MTSDDEGEGGVTIPPKNDDVIYEQPLMSGAAPFMDGKQFCQCFFCFMSLVLELLHYMNAIV